MNKQEPLSLLDLAAQSLLSDEDSAVRALEELPVVLFPTLSTAAFTGGHIKTVKALVQAWPFPCLHLGSLKDQSITQDLLEAVLDGLEFVPSEVCPRRSKLKVLDFTHDFEHSNWEECSETSPAPFVITHTLEEPEAEQLMPNPREQPQHTQEPVEIHTDLFLGGLFGFFHLSGFPSYILQRVERSHGCLRLCCRTLVINQVPFRSVVEILGMLELESIREVRLHHRSRFCLESDIIQFFTQVGQMSNLGNLIMSDIPWDFPADSFSLLSPLGHLQKLYLTFGYLSGQLHKMLSGLQKPLETLVINGCRLTENDITYLSQSVHATRLKELVLCSNNLSQTVPGPLEVLLGEMSGTLQHLNLRSCRLKESQLKALLPALCSCSRLRSLVFYDNVISTSGIMDVLECLARLMELKRVQYPVPTECVVYLDEYRWGNLNRVELARVHAKLQEMLQALQRADMQLTNSTSLV
ncbi:melanoma antigen preferentially expressed in tumors [Dasypus novemcinctus]|uniref:melanoma antigen preferentially expressed in tumors n=1 Tax=Dasypus novemcinctus TaxID=9361 RepID=UPI000C839621|nr:melanoma antigen preferentially expressed in tumors [Dasypus novemcinctus]XP_058137726.1 melanoma antigen preferentially expressed in tumors [Dasypus novemcinctus]XP_058137727.1 melanoma antigen preferentially expressed in tumors [Dasypus novemcinctus]